MNINEPTVPKIPEPPLGYLARYWATLVAGMGAIGALKEEQGGDTWRSTVKRKLGAGTEERRGSGSNTARRQMRDRWTEGQTGHACYAAEDPEKFRRNTRDGTRRRFENPPLSKQLTSVKFHSGKAEYANNQKVHLLIVD